jgi:hypothetical protein
MRFSYFFIPAGSAIDCRKNDFQLPIKNSDESLLALPKGCSFILDVGNYLGDGIVDHHQPGTENACVSSLITNNPKKYIGDFLNRCSSYNLVTHKSPDFDALCSIYLTEKYISHGKLPAFSKILSDYVLEVDSGKKRLDADHLVEPYSLILALSHFVYDDPKIDFQQKDYVVLERSFTLLDFIWNILEKGHNIETFDWLTIKGFDDEIVVIQNDYNKYQSDFLMSSFQAIELTNKYLNQSERVDCLFTNKPKSVLWKYWARSDKVHSPSRNGFQMNVAFLPSSKTRAIISVDPNSNYTLKGLGLYLDFLEMKELLKSQSIDALIQNSRVGFHRNNPWYDGRSTMHNYTIIDAPIEGSVLSPEVISDAVKKHHIWSNINCEYARLNAAEVLGLFQSNCNQTLKYQ